MTSSDKSIIDLVDDSSSSNQEPIPATTSPSPMLDCIDIYHSKTFDSRMKFRGDDDEYPSVGKRIRHHGTSYFKSIIKVSLKKSSVSEKFRHLYIRLDFANKFGIKHKRSFVIATQVDNNLNICYFNEIAFDDVGELFYYVFTHPNNIFMHGDRLVFWPYGKRASEIPSFLLSNINRKNFVFNSKQKELTSAASFEFTSGFERINYSVFFDLESKSISHIDFAYQTVRIPIEFKTAAHEDPHIKYKVQRDSFKFFIDALEITISLLPIIFQKDTRIVFYCVPNGVVFGPLERLCFSYNDKKEKLTVSTEPIQ